MWENIHWITGGLGFALIIIQAYWAVLNTITRRNHNADTSRPKSGMGVGDGGDGVGDGDGNGVDTE